ncbi:ribonuclease III [Pseudomonas aeruginosa]|nr:ribonuclease III [Pseudomonas aeruginosa]
MSNSLDRLERKLGYTFKDRDLMVLALTHRSYAGRNNERLEFLGDAILNFVIGEALFHHFPQAREGQLSRLRARLVKGETLALLARGFEVGDYLRLGSGELKSGGFRRESILADAMEALIGAIYLDTGMDSARERIIAWLGPQLRELTPVDTNKDPKTRLQEFLQSRGCDLPRYEVVDIQGEPPLPDLLRRLRSGPAERQDPRARRQPPHRRAGGRGRRAGGSGRGEWP